MRKTAYCDDCGEHRKKIHGVSLRTVLAERWKDFKGNRQKYRHERTLVGYSALVFLLLLSLEALAYWLFLGSNAGLLERYGWWVFYLDIAVVSIGAGMWHLNAHRGAISTMPGMMVGMTFGMQTGMMIGTIVAATNGLFVGGMTAMLSAVAVGVYNGKCCGIMGMLEGLMAGIMGGLMGSMVGTMYFADHILWLMPFFMLLNLAVMWGLSLMLLEEAAGGKRMAMQPSFASFASWCILAVSILIIIILYAPKSGLARVIA